MNRKLWMIALAVWFLLTAILSLTNVTFVFQGVVMGVIALIVAVLLFVDR